MYYLLNSPFILDLTATLSLFILCFLVVIGTKTVFAYVKSLFPKTKATPLEPKKEQPAPKRTYRKVSKPIRSIEINPEEIDRIYVKRIS